MKVIDYINEPVNSLLDVGCNVGALLYDCATRYPSAKLAGVEISKVALNKAMINIPTADFHNIGAEDLPFQDESFQYVTCVEVLEHIPSTLRLKVFREMHRVLKPNGRLILTVPHAGWFAWLDSNNIRFRMPSLYSKLIGRGLRDDTYTLIGRQVEWHYHFTLQELEQLAGDGWKEIAVRRGGLFIFPLIDLLSWPFYRLNVPNNPIRLMLERIGGWDNRIDFGQASYGILIVLEKTCSTTL